MQSQEPRDVHNNKGLPTDGDLSLGDDNLTIESVKSLLAEQEEAIDAASEDYVASPLKIELTLRSHFLNTLSLKVREIADAFEGCHTVDACAIRSLFADDVSARYTTQMLFNCASALNGIDAADKYKSLHIIQLFFPQYALSFPASNAETFAARSLQPDEGIPEQLLLETEEAVLAGCLISVEYFEVASAVIREKDFTRQEHRTIFGQVAELHDGGDELDAQKMLERLEKHAPPTYGDWAAVLSSIIETDVVLSDATSDAWAMLAAACRRSCNEAYASIDAVMYDSIGSLAKAVKNAAMQFQQQADRLDNANTVSAAKLVQGLLERLDTHKGDPAAASALPTGFHVFDEITGGLTPGELTIIAATSGYGINTLKLGVLENVALIQNEPVLVACSRADAQSSVDRLACKHAGVDASRLFSGHSSQADINSLLDASGRVANAPICFYKSEAPTLQEICSRATLQKSNDGLALLIVESIEGFTHESETEGAVDSLRLVTRRLSSLAKKLHIPVVCTTNLVGGADIKHSGSPFHEVGLSSDIDSAYSASCLAYVNANRTVDRNDSDPVVVTCYHERIGEFEFSATPIQSYERYMPISKDFDTAETSDQSKLGRSSARTA